MRVLSMRTASFEDLLDVGRFQLFEQGRRCGVVEPFRIVADVALSHPAELFQRGDGRRTAKAKLPLEDGLKHVLLRKGETSQIVVTIDLVGGPPESCERVPAHTDQAA